MPQPQCDQFLHPCLPKAWLTGSGPVLSSSMRVPGHPYSTPHQLNLFPIQQLEEPLNPTWLPPTQTPPPPEYHRRRERAKLLGLDFKALQVLTSTDLHSTYFPVAPTSSPLPGLSTSILHLNITLPLPFKRLPWLPTVLRTKSFPQEPRDT